MCCTLVLNRDRIRVGDMALEEGRKMIKIRKRNMSPQFPQGWERRRRRRKAQTLQASFLW